MNCITDKNTVEAEILSDQLLPGRPFRNKLWKGHLFEGGYHFDEEGFTKLLKAINASCNDEFLCALNFGVYKIVKDNPVEYEDTPVNWKIGLSWKEFDDTVQSSPFYTLGIYMWSKSMTWGAICSHNEFVVIGGDDKFMKALENEYGGYNKIRDDFIEYFEEGGPNLYRDWGEELISNFYPEFQQLKTGA